MLGLSDEEFAATRQETSRVAFGIEPAAEPSLGVRLTITHDGFDGPDSPMLRAVSGGWVMILSELKSVLEGAGPVAG